MKRLLTALFTVVVLGALVAVATAAQPSAATGPAENVTDTTATVTGTANPNGEDTVYYFEFGTTEGQYTSRTPDAEVQGRNNPREVQAQLTGL